MDVRNPSFTADGRVDCEFEHPLFGWIPFTASPDDPSPLGQAIYEFAVEVGPAPYVAPPEAEDVHNTPAGGFLAKVRAVFSKSQRRSESEATK